MDENYCDRRSANLYHREQSRMADLLPRTDGHVASGQGDDLWQKFSLRPASHLPNLRLEDRKRLRRDAPLTPVILDAESQELPLLWWCDRGLRLVDLEL